jgi:uncharacterized protein
MRTRRFVVDTNTLISRLLLPGSMPAKATQKALEEGELVFSNATLEELNEVLSRPKFDRYIHASERAAFFRLLSRLAVVVEISHRITACRDPKDDKFLEVAVHGPVQAVVSGDKDLLELHPFRGIAVMNPRSFVEEFDDAHGHSV